MVHCSFSFTHPHFLWFFGHGFVRENADPNGSFPFHVTGHGNTGGLNLPACNPYILKGFETETAKGNFASFPGNATVTPFVRLPVCRAFWL
jgi:hypothetical protein